MTCSRFPSQCLKLYLLAAVSTFGHFWLQPVIVWKVKRTEKAKHVRYTSSEIETKNPSYIYICTVNTHDILWWCLDMFKPSVLPCCKSLQVCSLLKRAMGTPTTWWVRWETEKKSTDVLFRIPCAVSHRLQPSSMILRTCARTQLMKVTMLFSWVDHQIRCQICEVAQERPDGNYIWHASLVLLYYLQATCRVANFNPISLPCSAFSLPRNWDFYLLTVW